MNLSISQLPAGAAVQTRWVKQGPGFTFTEAPAARDQAEFNPTEPGSYWGVAWAQDPATPYWRGALIWLDAAQRFGFKQGGWPAADALGGYVSTFASGTV